MNPLRIRATLASDLAGDPPALDALLEVLAAPTDPDGRPGHEVDRNFPAPEIGVVTIPIGRRSLGPWEVAACTSPIFVGRDDRAEYINKPTSQLDPDLLGEDHRQPFATNRGWTKSYRLPLRVRRVAQVAWFAFGDRQACLDLLGQCRAIGKKIAVGYGKVARWEVEAAPEDLSWFAPTRRGPVLMTTLPDGTWLPPDLIGFRRDFGACCPPYWHPDRYTEIVVPC